MKVALVALFLAVVAVSYAEDCSENFKEYRKCLGESRKKDTEAMKAKFEALKPKLDDCYTSNGCTPPQPRNHTRKSSGEASGEKSGEASGEKSGGSSSGSGEKGNKTEKVECWRGVREALKAKFEDCIKASGVNLSGNASEHKKHFKAERGHFRKGHHGGWNKKHENKALEGCAKKEQVRECKRQLFNSSKPSEDERKAKFEEHCKAKDTCKAVLSAQCASQLIDIKKAIGKCVQEGKDQFEQVRSSVPACASVPQKKKRNGERKQEEHKDPCDLGFAAFEQQQKARFASRKNETQQQ